MRFATRHLRVSGKLGLLAALLLIGAFALAREGRPAEAAGTQLWIATNSMCTGIAMTDTVLFTNLSPLTLYVCAKNVSKDSFGAAAFNLDFSYVSWLLAVQSASLDSTSPQLAKQWLASTGRAAQCVPVLTDTDVETGAGRVYGGCQTLEPSPPAPIGPTTNHALAKITLTGGITKTLTMMDFRDGPVTSGTQLVSANFQGGISTASPIPSTVPVLPVYIAPCGDFTSGAGAPTPPDNTVAIVDILYEAGKFGQNSTQPGWNPNWDMDGNNTVAIADILIVAREYGRVCVPPP